jgi:hypothetical protein
MHPVDLFDDSPLHAPQPTASYQPRDGHGRYATWGRSVPGYLYDRHDRSLWRRVRPQDRLRSGAPLRFDAPDYSALYVRCRDGEQPPLVPPMTPRNTLLCVCMLVDFGLAAWASHELYALGFDWFGQWGLPIVVFAIAFSMGISLARFAAWVWKAPPPARNTFYTIDELAEMKGWRKPRNAHSDNAYDRERREDDDE